MLNTNKEICEKYSLNPKAAQVLENYMLETNKNLESLPGNIFDVINEVLTHLDNSVLALGVFVTSLEDYTEICCSSDENYCMLVGGSTDDYLTRTEKRENLLKFKNESLLMQRILSKLSLNKLSA